MMLVHIIGDVIVIEIESFLGINVRQTCISKFMQKREATMENCLIRFCKHVVLYILEYIQLKALFLFETP